MWRTPLSRRIALALAVTVFMVVGLAAESALIGLAAGLLVAVAAGAIAGAFAHPR